LERAGRDLHATLASKLGGNGMGFLNKAVVTQSLGGDSVVRSYLSLLPM